ncbi:hypothetical protein BBJ28_00015653 [Nothophytophthora sp. Chile5]|nr:hypothetical protein BBJ28_00015653 [Nothophytophthora sp. Chile5]
MASPSPVELLEPSHVPSPALKPISCLRVLVAKCVHAWAKIHVSYRGGRYSIERLLALDEYTRNTPLLRVLLVCVATPLPMAVLVISQEVVPLQDPTAGWQANYGYWIRMGVVTLAATNTITTQAKFLVEGFAISWHMIFAAYMPFPIPFAILAKSPAFFALVIVSFRVIAGRRVIREMLARKDQMITFVSFLCAQELMVVIYPAYQVLFQAMINTPYKLPVILLLPLIKLIVKNIALRCVTHMEDMMPEAVIFTVDFFNALYLATCMESAASMTTVLTIVSTDLAQTASVLYGLYWRTATILQRLRSIAGIPSGDDNLLTRANFLCRSLEMLNNQIRVRIRSCLPHRLSSADRNLLGSLEKLPVKETAASPDSPPTAQGKVHTLEALFTSECIVLTAYLETVIPIFYGNFMLIMVRLPSAKYHTELTGVTGENVGTKVNTVFLFAALQILSFVLLSALIRRNLGMKALYQLAFVLETQMELIQSKLTTWVLASTLLSRSIGSATKAPVMLSNMWGGGQMDWKDIPTAISHVELATVVTSVEKAVLATRLMEIPSAAVRIRSSERSSILARSTERKETVQAVQVLRPSGAQNAFGLRDPPTTPAITRYCYRNSEVIKDGAVTLYSDTHFHGVAHQFPIEWTGKCYNLNACHDDNSGSVKWKGLPTNGSFHGKAHIAFYTNRNCKGFHHDWSTDVQEKNTFPNDFMIDGIYNKVSSIVVYTNIKHPVGGVDAKCT